MTAESYSEYCAPTTLAALLDCSRLEAARFLMERGAKGRGGGTTIMGWHSTLTELGGVEVSPYDPEGKERRQKALYEYRMGRRRKYPGVALQRPTVAKFLRRNPKGVFVIWTTSHTLLAKDGKVVKDTQTSNSMRARVFTAFRFKELEG